MVKIGVVVVVVAGAVVIFVYVVVIIVCAINLALKLSQNWVSNSCYNGVGGHHTKIFVLEEGDTAQH